MNREEIITRTADNTGIDMNEVITLCGNWLDYIQEDICSRHNFSWLKKYATITTVAEYSTGTIAVTNGSTTVTGTDTVWTSAMANRFIYLPDSNWYEISSGDTGTQITLKTAYVGDDATAQTYKIRKVYYSLASDFGKMLSVTTIEPSAKKISHVTEELFTDFVQDPFLSTADIYAYMFAGVDASNNTQVKFRPIPTDARLVNYAYILKLSTMATVGLTSKIPAFMHDLFIFKMSEIIFNRADLDGKAQSFKLFYEEALAKFVKADMEKSADRKEIYADERIAGRGMAFARLDPDHYPRN